jgi:hypothetical protein
MGFFFFDLNIFSFLFLKVDRGPYRKGRRPAGCSSLLYKIHAPVEQRQAARLHSQLTLAVAWQSDQIPLDNLLRYQRNLGDIPDEGVVNQSPREQGLVRDHYQRAQHFFQDNPKTTLLEVMMHDFEPLAGHSVLLEDGQHALLVFNEGERYQLYSPDFNYARFHTRPGVS